jgi:hypothetical protein
VGFHFHLMASRTIRNRLVGLRTSRHRRDRQLQEREERERQRLNEALALEGAVEANGLIQEIEHIERLKGWERLREQIHNGHFKKESVEDLLNATHPYFKPDQPKPWEE